MEFFSAIAIILGLCFFEVVSSVDNAVINAEVLSTMGQKARKWFLLWGMLFAVFIVRGLLPWGIIFATAPSLGPIGALTASFSSDPHALAAIEEASPILLTGGGIFLIFLFFHWLFLEPKRYGLRGERFFHTQGVWFYAIISIILSVVVWLALKQSTYMAFAAVIGSTAFFITHGFKQNAEAEEAKLLNVSRSDVSKILYLEVIDATFSIDGVLGAFAFTLSIPLILLGSGLGAIVLRQLTISNIDRIKKYVYLKNGAMYSILFLGSIMLLNGFGLHTPEWITPIITFLIVGYFFFKSKREAV